MADFLKFGIKSVLGNWPPESSQEPGNTCSRRVRRSASLRPVQKVNRVPLSPQGPHPVGVLFKTGMSTHVHMCTHALSWMIWFPPPWPGRSTVFQLTSVLKTDRPIVGEEGEAVVKHRYNDGKGAVSPVHFILNRQPACAWEKAAGVQSHAELFSSPSPYCWEKGSPGVWLPEHASQGQDRSVLWVSCSEWFLKSGKSVIYFRISFVYCGLLFKNCCPSDSSLARSSCQGFSNWNISLMVWRAALSICRPLSFIPILSQRGQRGLRDLYLCDASGSSVICLCLPEGEHTQVPGDVQVGAGSANVAHRKHNPWTSLWYPDP